MPEETLLDSIEVIGDGISAINQRLANTLPTEAGFSQLEQERDRALDKLHLLVRVFTANSTLRFIKADSELATVNADMIKTLNQVAKLQNTINMVTRFISAIDTIIASVSQVL
jgi:hypothetical protein